MKEQIQDFLSGEPFYGEGAFAQVLFWVAEDYRAAEFPHETLMEPHLYQYSQVPELCALWAPFGRASVSDIFYRAEWQEEQCDCHNSGISPCMLCENYGAKSQMKIVPKQKEIRSLFELLLTLKI